MPDMVGFISRSDTGQVHIASTIGGIQIIQKPPGKNVCIYQSFRRIFSPSHDFLDVLRKYLAVLLQAIRLVKNTNACPHMIRDGMPQGHRLVAYMQNPCVEQFDKFLLPDSDSFISQIIQHIIHDLSRRFQPAYCRITERIVTTRKQLQQNPLHLFRGYRH